MQFTFSVSSRRLSIVVLVIALLVIVQGSCTHEPFEPKTVTVHIPPPDQPVDTNSDNTPPTQPVITGCDEDSIFFQRDIQPLFIAKCGSTGGCHSVDSAQGNLVLSTFDTTLNSGVVIPFDPSNSLLYQRITAPDTSKRMPPPAADQLDAKDMQKIFLWIQDGAVDCDSTNVSYASTVRPLLEFYKCLDCHKSGSGIADLSNYQGVKAQADNDTLYGVIAHLQGFPQMPQDTDKMDLDHILQIKAWIDGGAEDN